MKPSSLLIMVVVLAFMSGMSPLNAVAQQGPGARGVELAPRGGGRAVPKDCSTVPCVRKISAATLIMVDWLGGRLAGITQPATVATADLGMWVVSVLLQIEGVPDYMSDIEVANDAATGWLLAKA